MFEDFESLNLEREMRILNVQINISMAKAAVISDLLDKVPFTEEFAFKLLNDAYWKHSNRNKVLFSVQDAMQKIIDYPVLHK